MTLRDYQVAMLERIRREWQQHSSIMVQMPTGTGKTHVLAAVVREHLENVPTGMVWIVAHRRELVEQIHGRIREMENEKWKIENRVRVVSIQWLTRNWEKIEGRSREEKPGLIVIDEAHHALAETYRELWRRYPEARKLGMTATPCRLNNQGFRDLFEVLLQSWSITEFIQKGQLSVFDYVSIRPNSREQRLIESLQKRGADGDYQVKEMNEVLNRRPSIERLHAAVVHYAAGKKGIVYAISIEHARRIAAYYSERGIVATAIDSKTPAQERKRQVEAFKEGKIQVLVNVDVFSEGFDCPDVEFVQLARPTLSLAKYLQQVGRGLRKVKGKTSCMLIDNVGLHRVFGLPTRNWDWNALFEGRIRGKAIAPAKYMAATATSSYTSTASVPITEEMEVVVSHEELWECLHHPSPTALRQGLRYYADDIVAVSDEQGNIGYVDLKTNRQYRNKPFVLRYGEGEGPVVELLQLDNHYYSRTRVGYENRSCLRNAKPVWCGWYLKLADLFPPKEYRYVAGMASDSVASACILAGDEEEVYWLCCRLADGSLVVMDRKGCYYHAEPGKAKRFVARTRPQQGEAGIEVVIPELIRSAEERLEILFAQKQQQSQAKRERRLSEIKDAQPFRMGLKWGLKLGERIVVPPKYRMVLPPVGRYCAYEENPCQWGVMAIDGRVEVEARYMKVDIERDNTAALTVYPGKVKRVKLG